MTSRLVFDFILTCERCHMSFNTKQDLINHEKNKCIVVNHIDIIEDDVFIITELINTINKMIDELTDD